METRLYLSTNVRAVLYLATQTNRGLLNARILHKAQFKKKGNFTSLQAAEAKSSRSRSNGANRCQLSTNLKLGNSCSHPVVGIGEVRVQNFLFPGVVVVVEVVTERVALLDGHPLDVLVLERQRQVRRAPRV